MARRPLALRSLAIVAAALCALAQGCAGSAQESNSPPPITASSTPAPSLAPAASPSSFSTPASERAAMEERVVPPSPPTSAPASSPTPEPTPHPLQWLQDQQARKADYDRRVENLEAKLASARDLVAARERELLAFKNPFLARPQLTSDEAAAIQGMDGAARVRWSEGRLADANAALEAAQKAYDEAKANPPPQ